MGLGQAIHCLVTTCRLRVWGIVVFALGLGLGCDGYMSTGNASLDQPTSARDAARDASPPPSDIGDDPDRSRNWSIFERLKPSCQACHLQGSSQPMFASLEAFENLLVYNIHFVVPRDPDASELIALLEGRGTRQFEQMPVGEKSFGELEAEGNTEITIEEVREFIRQLEPRQGGDGGNAQAALMRRLSARQIQRALQTQLGLTNDDLTPVFRTRGLPSKGPKSSSV